MATSPKQFAPRSLFRTVDLWTAAPSAQAGFGSNGTSNVNLPNGWNLCEFCALKREEYGERDYEMTFAYLRQSLEEGRCAFCNAINKTLEEYGGWEQEHRFASQGQFRVRNGFVMCSGIYYSVMPDVHGPLPTSFFECISIVRQQLADCTSNSTHDCRPEASPDDGWPARILEVSESDVVTLKDFNTATMAGEFAALSYCWGDPFILRKHPPLLTTARTLDQLRTGIPKTELPLTLRQAVDIISELGIRYIWIDSLCIIQDSEADWQIEARKMATVYAMSKVTIIAGSSTSCHSGFLCPRGTPDVPKRWEREQLSGFHNLATWDIQTGTWNGHRSPIENRGWTYQEELLSTRYIKFTENDIQWSCRLGGSCYCGQNISTTYLRRGKAITKLSLEESARQTQDVWGKIVNEYTMRSFTKDTDKLVAIASIAKRLTMGSMPVLSLGTRFQYLAGVWLDMDGPNYDGLLWYVDSRSRLGRLTTAYVAPSFSWASLNFDPPEGHSYAHGEFRLATNISKLIGATTEPLIPNDIFGRIKSGKLTVYGPLVPCFIRSQDGVSTLTPDASTGFPGFSEVYFDAYLARKEGSVSRSSKPTSFDDSSAYVLILRKTLRVTGTEFEGLILGRMVDSVANYERLGTWIVEGHHENLTSCAAKYTQTVTIH